jgi:hypothetical protein
VTEEASDDDFCDVGSVGTPAAAHIHHPVLPPHNQTKNKKGREREIEWCLEEGEEGLEGAV